MVDEENLLGQLYGFKAVPNGFLIDELGVVRYKKLGGFDIRHAESAQVIDKWLSEPALDGSHDANIDELGSEHSEANSYFREGLALHREGKIEEALAVWRKGMDLEPDNWIIRKQIWAVENPDKFYEGRVDFDWQKEQIAQGR